MIFIKSKTDYIQRTYKSKNIKNKKNFDFFMFFSVNINFRENILKFYISILDRFKEVNKGRCVRKVVINIHLLFFFRES